MELLNRNLRCGGENGCGQMFVFVKGETVEDARVVFKTHREDPRHPDWVAEHKGAPAEVMDMIRAQRAQRELLDNEDG